jgi:endonuclease III
MDKDARVLALLNFSIKIQPRELFAVTREGAAALVEKNPFAFALAAVLDRGTKSEIIWTIPYDLKMKIGTLTPQFFAGKSFEELESLFRSLQNKPRYITDAPRTAKGLAQIVLNEYDGDTRKIWQNHTSTYVKSVFRRIYGVGPGIASMIVLLLEKCFKMNFTDLDHKNMDVKPDVHVVRVFQRLGFISIADATEALRAARKFNPEYPGALDAPAWIIGKKWCTPFGPQCTACVMGAVCPKNM